MFDTQKEALLWLSGLMDGEGYSRRKLKIEEFINWYGRK